MELVDLKGDEKQHGRAHAHSDADEEHGHSHGAGGTCHGHSHAGAGDDHDSHGGADHHGHAHDSGNGAHAHSHGGGAVSIPVLGGGGGSGGSGIVGSGPGKLSHMCRGLNLNDDGAATALARKRLIASCVLCGAFMFAELIGGYFANSLSIMTDAAHLASDLAGMLISLVALWLARIPATAKLTYGYHRAEVIGALLSVVLIWVMTLVLLYEAVHRLIEPEDVDGKLMFAVSTAGLGVNIIMGLVLWQTGHGHSHGSLGGGGEACHGHGEHSHSHSHGHGGARSDGTKAPKRKKKDSLIDNEHSPSATVTVTNKTRTVSGGGNMKYAALPVATTISPRSAASAAAAAPAHAHGGSAHGHAHADGTWHAHAHGGSDDDDMPALTTRTGAAPGGGTASAAGSSAAGATPSPPAASAALGDSISVVLSDSTPAFGPAGPKDSAKLSGAAALLMAPTFGDDPASGSDDGHAHAHGAGDDHGHAHSHGGGDDHGHSHSRDGGGGGGDHGHPHGIGVGSGDDSDDDDDAHGHSHAPEENINVRAAFIHVIGDGIQSVGVMIAAAIIWAEPSARIADPLCTFLFSILVFFTTVKLARQCIAILMEATPEGVAPPDVEAALKAIDGVRTVRDLHVWELTVGKSALSAHVFIAAGASARAVLQRAHLLCAKKFKVHHTTIQVEHEDQPVDCGTCRTLHSDTTPLLTAT